MSSRIVHTSAPDSRHHRRAASEFARFVEKLHQQAIESREERWPLYVDAGLASCGRVLDVGCGPGAVTADVVEAVGDGDVVALDAASDMLRQARAYLGARDPVTHRVPLVQGDSHRLPFPSGTFDAVVCNLFLMWARDPQAAVDEMARVVRPGGVVLASLEPDFGGKLHYPEDPEIDRVFQGEAIRRRGGDPHIGRKLRALFVRAGLQTVVGLGNRRIWSAEEDRRSFERAIDLYRSMLRANGLSLERISAWEAQQLADFDAGISFQFFPQFYAIGRRLA
jgi:ubiquinone/menaquinone biosynthesis C-methylase UbiE